MNFLLAALLCWFLSSLYLIPLLVSTFQRLRESRLQALELVQQLESVKARESELTAELLSLSQLVKAQAQASGLAQFH